MWKPKWRCKTKNTEAWEKEKNEQGVSSSSPDLQAFWLRTSQKQEWST